MVQKKSVERQTQTTRHRVFHGRKRKKTLYTKRLSALSGLGEEAREGKRKSESEREREKKNEQPEKR